MKKIETQQENIKELLKLVQENPELVILPMVATECVFSDDYSYWTASWGKPTIDEYYVSDERVYFKSTDYDELVEENLEYYQQEAEMYEGESEDLTREAVDKFNWIKAIVVHINEL